MDVFICRFKVKSSNVYNISYSSSTDKDSVDSSKQPSTETHKDDMMKTVHPQDLSGATFLDVAVLRCLFITHWQEEGIYWALHYMYNR